MLVLKRCSVAQEGGVPASSQRTCPSNSCLTLASVTREQGGVYTCSADNGVGSPDTATIALTVQCEYLEEQSALQAGTAIVALPPYWI